MTRQKPDKSVLFVGAFHSSVGSADSRRKLHVKINFLKEIRVEGLNIFNAAELLDIFKKTSNVFCIKAYGVF